jgi:hypothetical protein
MVEPGRQEAAGSFFLQMKTTSGGQLEGRKRPRPPWKVAGFLLDTPEARQELRSYLTVKSNFPLCSFVHHPPHHLWRPDPLVQYHLLPLLSNELVDERLLQLKRCNGKEASSSSPGRRRRRLDVWDLGSGSGRDLVFLSSQLLRVVDSGGRPRCEGRKVPEEQLQQEQGKDANLDEHHLEPSLLFRVVGMDHRYRSGAGSESLQAFLRREGVEDVAEGRHMDLSLGKDNYEDDGLSSSLSCGGGCFRRAFLQEKPVCVYAVRFWNRPLWEFVRDRAEAGTIVAVSHFAKPAEGSGWPFSHPKVRICTGVFPRCFPVFEGGARLLPSLGGRI